MRRAPLSNHVQRLQSFFNKCVRSICEISMRDMLRNTEIRRRGNIERVDSILQLKRLKWLGHIEKMADFRWPKKLLVSKICGSKRSQGGQKHRWHDVVNNDLKAIGSGWRSKAKDRIEWRKSINTLIIDLNQNKEQSEKNKKDRKKKLNVQYNNTNNICGEVNINNGVLNDLVCSFSGCNKAGLANHIRQKHSQQATITILCQHCGRNFKRQGFQNHQKKCATTRNGNHSLHLPDGGQMQ